MAVCEWKRMRLILVFACCVLYVLEALNVPNVAVRTVTSYTARWWKEQPLEVDFVDVDNFTDFDSNSSHAADCVRWAKQVKLNFEGGPEVRELVIAHDRNERFGRPKRTRWSSKFPPVHGIPPRFPTFRSTRVVGLGLRSQFNNATQSDIVFCPGRLRVSLHCSDCVELSNNPPAVYRAVAALLTGDAPLPGVALDLAMQPDDRSSADVLLTNSSVTPAQQPVWEAGMRELRFGPDGFVGRLTGPEAHVAIGTLSPRNRVVDPARNGSLLYDVVFDVGRVGHAIGVGLFALSVQHVWSAWLHVQQHQHYSAADPLDLVAVKVLILLPPPSSEGGDLNRTTKLPGAVWQRFDSVQFRNRPRLIAPNTTYQPADMLVYPYASPDKFTHRMPCSDGWYWWQPPPRYTHEEVSRVPAAVWSTVWKAPLTPRPRADCDETIIAPGSCNLRRTIWRLLNLRSDATGRLLFRNLTFAMSSESQGFHLHRQIEQFANGVLDGHALVRDKESAIKRFAKAFTNGAPIPFSNVVSKNYLRFHAIPPSAEAKRIRESEGALNMTWISHTEWYQLNVTRVPRAVLESDLVGFMFCQFCIIWGLALEDYEVRFARYLLALHGIGPDAARANGTISNTSVVFVVPCTPVAVLNAFLLRNTVDGYRMKFKDHRNLYSVALYVRSMRRVVDAVNVELTRRGRQPVLFVNVTDAFLHRIDDSYDGDHFFGTDANLAVSAMLLHDLAVEMLRREGSRGTLMLDCSPLCDSELDEF